MKRSEFKKGLSAYLRKRDRHLALTKEMADQLAHYALLYVDRVGLLPPLIKEVVPSPEYDGDTDSWIGDQDEYTPVFALQWEPEGKND